MRIRKTKQYNPVTLNIYATKQTDKPNLPESTPKQKMQFSLLMPLCGPLHLGSTIRCIQVRPEARAARLRAAASAAKLGAPIDNGALGQGTKSWRSPRSAGSTLNLEPPNLHRTSDVFWMCGFFCWLLDLFQWFLLKSRVFWVPRRKNMQNHYEITSKSNF